jgi:hypothetical protein
MKTHAPSLLLFSLLSFAAPGQDALPAAPDTPRRTVEEIFQQRNPNQSRALLAGESVRYLALDHPGGRYRFFPGDAIKFRLRTDHRRYNDLIQSVGDSAFYFLVENPVTQRGESVAFRLSDVDRVYTTRRVPFLSEGMVLFPAAGLIYFIADVFHPGNQLRRGEGASLTTGTAIVTGTFFGLGFLGYKLTFQVHHLYPGGKRRLRVLRTY